MTKRYYVSWSCTDSEGEAGSDGDTFPASDESAAIAAAQEANCWRYSCWRYSATLIEETTP